MRRIKRMRPKTDAYLEGITNRTDGLKGDWTDTLKVKGDKRHKRQRLHPDERRKLAQEEDERIPRGMKWHVKRTLSGTLAFQRKRLDGDEQTRWYVLGRVKVAFVHIFNEGTQAWGNVAVYMNSNPGNGAEWFDTLRQAEKYIVGQLEEGM